MSNPHLGRASSHRQTGFVLRPRDRVVFVGDSITEQRTYTNDVENYLLCRYPELKLEFVNAGWAGDTAAGGVKRLQRDVLALRPDVVLFCYGMNDAGWGYATPADAAARYRANLLDMIVRLRARGVRVVLLTPGVLDDSLPGLAWLKERTDYNAVDLAALKRATLRIARERGLPAFDLHALMGRVLQRSRRYGVGLGPDGIHPDEAASLIMTYATLRALGVPRRTEVYRVDVRPGRRQLSPGVSRVVADGRTVSFSVTPRRLPGYAEDKARPMLPFIPLTDEFNDLRLVVRGLVGERWLLRVDGGLGPVVTRAELARGIRLSDMWGTRLLERARRVALITRERANAYRQFWRAVALPDNYDVGATYDPAPHRLAIGFAREVARWRRGQVRVPALPVTLTALESTRRPVLAGAPLTLWRIGRGFSPVPAAELTPSSRLALTRPGGAIPESWWAVSLNGGDPEPLRRLVYTADVPASVEALVTIASASRQKFDLALGPEVAAALTVNGVPGPSLAQEATDRRVRVVLRKGVNRLLVRLTSKAGRVAGLPVRVVALPRPAWQL